MGVELDAQHQGDPEQERPEHEQQERAEDRIRLETLTEDGRVERESGPTVRWCDELSSPKATVGTIAVYGPATEVDRLPGLADVERDHVRGQRHAGQDFVREIGGPDAAQAAEQRSCADDIGLSIPLAYRAYHLLPAEYLVLRVDSNLATGWLQGKSVSWLGTRLRVRRKPDNPRDRRLRLGLLDLDDPAIGVVVEAAHAVLLSTG